MCICLFVFPDTPLKTLETRLTSASGEERVEILTELAQGYRSKEPKKTLQYGRQGLNLLRTFPHPKNKVTILNAVAAANIKLGQYETARRYVKQSLAAAQKNNDKPGYAEAVYLMGRVYRYLAAYDEAIDYFSRARKLYTQLGDQKRVGKTHNSTGLVYWKLSDYTNALEHILIAGEIYEEVGYQKGLATVYNNTAIIHRQMNDLEKALLYYNKAWKIRKELGDKDSIAKIFNNIAIIYKKQEKFDDALNYYEQSLKLKRERGNKKGIAITLNNIGELYQKKNHHDRALVYFSESLEIKKTLNDKKGIAHTLINIGNSNRKLGRHKEALNQLNRAFSIAVKTGIKDEIQKSYRELSYIMEALKDYPKALAYYKEYKKISDSIFNEKNSKKITELQSRYELEKKEKEITLLKKDKQLQELDLVRQTNFKNSLIIVSGLVLLLAFVIYARYRFKTRLTLALQEEIEHRKQAEAELLKSQKLEAVGILAGGIAHDFNNLLAIIIGNLDMVIDEINDNPAMNLKLKAMERASYQAAELAEKLVTFSKGGWIIPREITLEALLNSTRAIHPELRSLHTSISIPPGLPSINGDERQLRQVFQNLLQNAGEASEDSKEITIEAEEVRLDSGNDLSLNEGKYLKISVKDRGKGIPPENMEKIFDPYFSTKDTVTQKGMGLGLAICYSIIKKHDGHIAIHSQVGKGTTVELYLPTHEKKMN
jgi:signal transduction histidine kinase